MSTEDLVIFELFSGIGGMHFAFKQSLLSGKVFAAIDINEKANEVYQHNFPSTVCLSRNIQKIDLKQFQAVNSILMSPPCSPFTIQGNFLDSDDNRCEALITVCSWIKESKLNNLKYILMENVKGFEKSRMREQFIEALKSAGFYYQEFIITPTIIGIPNTRHRYYCIARKSHDFSFKTENILTHIPGLEIVKIQPLLPFLDLTSNDCDEFMLSDKLLSRRLQVLDIRTSQAENSMCFTRAYTRFLEGTGSVYSQLPLDELNEKLAKIDCKSDDDMEIKRSLKLRFFTPEEIARLMAFPENFTFTQSISVKQKYKLLGNSINVNVVSFILQNLLK